MIIIIMSYPARVEGWVNIYIHTTLDLKYADTIPVKK